MSRDENESGNRLSTGARVGPYEILGFLGSGGMGEVYRARDERLKREVAVKVLPAALSSDAHRMKRFEQEAHAAGRLNHPNIAAVYDVGSHDGVPYIVSEFLEGETLRARLARGSLPARKAVEFATQIAQGLAAAHEKGIVHRDLKPENLFLTKDGIVKILDFGLAKLTHGEEQGGGPTNAATATAVSEAGVVLGTLGYMSPEQVRGLSADRRSDIFSFGAVLYEMLLGLQAFRGISRVEILSRILEEDPPELYKIDPKIPPGLMRIVGRCLEKEPGDRFESIKDVGFALNAYARSSEEPGAGSVAALPSQQRFWRRVLGATLALLTGIAIGVLASRRPREVLPLFHRLTFRAGPIWSARFAPDGQTIVYSGTQEGKPHQLFSTRADTTEWTRLPLPSANILSISSSGKMAIAMWPERGWKPQTLAEASLAGGAPREILVEEGELCADWSPDGKDLAIVRDFGDHGRLEFPIGRVLYENARGKLGGPRFSPDGKAIAIFEEIAGDESIALVDLAGKKRTLSSGWTNIEAGGCAWNPKTGEIWFSGRELSGGAAAQLALHAVSPSGRHRLVARLPASVGIADIYRDGRVLLAVSDYPFSMFCLPPGSTKEVDLAWLDFSNVVDISEDGKAVLFDERGSLGSDGAVYLRRTDGSPAVRLGAGRAAALSVDGKWAIAIPSTSDRLVMLPTGAGESRVLRQQDLNYASARFFPDGKEILFSAGSAGHPARLYVSDVAGGSSRPLTPEGFEIGPVSPDGKLVASRDPDGRVVLIPVAGGEAQPVPGIGADERILRWDGRGEGLFLAKEGAPTRIDRFVLSTGDRTPVREITPADPSSIVVGIDVALTPDGNSYAYSFARELSYLYVVDGLR